jgi:pimeloyl-ACP methyl ester carboxylesterase
VERVDVDGLAIAYERAGTGAPMVLLHGYVGDGPSVWRHQIDALSDEYTVVAWDAPGAGGSPDPPETFGIAGYADYLARFIEGRGWAGAHRRSLVWGRAWNCAAERRRPRLQRRAARAIQR